MIADSMARQGSWFFRWRSYVLLGFAPLAFLVITQPEPIETAFGTMADTLFEIGLHRAGLCRPCHSRVHGRVRAGRYIRAKHQKTSGSDAEHDWRLLAYAQPALSRQRRDLHGGRVLFAEFWFSVLMLLFLVLYLERIIATEEEFLTAKFGDAYRDWASEVPAFFPRFSGWQAPELPFSLRNVLRREYSGFFAVIAVFFVLDQSREYLAESKAAIDPQWLAVFGIGALVYLALRWAKKHTRLLNVVGR